jgi:hypothetical protein
MDNVESQVIDVDGGLGVEESLARLMPRPIEERMRRLGNRLAGHGGPAGRAGRAGQRGRRRCK